MTEMLAVLDHRARRDALESRLVASGLDAAVIWQPPTVCYFTGNEISGPNAVLWERRSGWVVVADEYDAWNFAVMAQGLQVRTYPYTSSLWPELAHALLSPEPRPSTVGVEFAEIRQASIDALRAGIPNAALTSIDEDVAALRLVKSSAELNRHRDAATAVAAAYGTVRRMLRSSTSERAVAAAVYDALIDAGSDYVASQPYVKSGDRALLTHARWGTRDIAPSDHVLVEIGASVGRYHASLMRTRLMAEPATSYTEVARAVVAGRDALMAAAQPGARAGDLHDAYVGALARRGYASANRHPAGYSLGIAFPPYWGELPLLTITAGADRRLEPGMVLHLISGLTEPAAGIPHIGLSECVLITPTGPLRLIEEEDFL